MNNEVDCIACRWSVMGAIGSCLVSCLLTLKMNKERNLKLSVYTDGPHLYGFCIPLGVKILVRYRRQTIYKNFTRLTNTMLCHISISFCNILPQYLK